MESLKSLADPSRRCLHKGSVGAGVLTGVHVQTCRADFGTAVRTWEAGARCQANTGRTPALIRSGNVDCPPLMMPDLAILRILTVNCINQAASGAPRPLLCISGKENC